MSYSAPHFPRDALGNVEQHVSVAAGERWAIRGKAETEVLGLFRPLRLGLLLLLGSGALLAMSPDGFLSTLSNHINDSQNQSQVGDFFLFVAGMTLFFFLVISVKASANFRRRGFGVPVVLRSQTSFRVGEPLDLEFVREATDGRRWPSGKFTMQVVCEEVTRTVKGTDVTYSRVPKWQSGVQTFQVPEGQQAISGRLTVTPPAHLPPNTQGNGHWIFWKIVIVQDFGLTFTEKNEYVLPVYPKAEDAAQTESAHLRA